MRDGEIERRRIVTDLTWSIVIAIGVVIVIKVVVLIVAWL